MHELLNWDSGKTNLYKKLSDYVNYFQISIPSNENGVPRYYIDPSVIIPVLMDYNIPEDIPDEVLLASKIPLETEEGCPTIDGIPFWERLEGEAIPYYNLFKEYRDMPYTKTEGLFTRSLAQLSADTMLQGKQLNLLSKVYHWVPRCRAFDIYKQQQRQNMVRRDQEKLLKEHSKVANQLLDQAVNYLMEHPEQLNPKTATELANLAIRTGRLSLGLSPDKPDDGSHSNDARNSRPQISIINQNNNTGENGTIQNINAVDNLSAVERKTKENTQDLGHLQSILHVLNQSGAFAQAIAPEEKVKEYDGTDENYNTIDAEYTEVSNE